MMVPAVGTIEKVAGGRDRCSGHRGWARRRQVMKRHRASLLVGLCILRLSCPLAPVAPLSVMAAVVMLLLSGEHQWSCPAHWCPAHWTRCVTAALMSAWRALGRPRTVRPTRRRRRSRRRRSRGPSPSGRGRSFRKAVVYPSACACAGAIPAMGRAVPRCRAPRRDYPGREPGRGASMRGPLASAEGSSPGCRRPRRCCQPVGAANAPGEVG